MNANFIQHVEPKEQQEQWVTDFTKGDTKGRDFLTTEMNKRYEFQPTYAKGRTWLSLFGHSITFCARAIRTILNHAPISQYRARFHPQEPVACPCGESDLQTRTYILTECLRFTENLPPHA